MSEIHAEVGLEKRPLESDFVFPQHLVEGLLNFSWRVCRSFWLDSAFQDHPGKTDQCLRFIIFLVPPTKLSTRVLKPQRSFFFISEADCHYTNIFYSLTVQYFFSCPMLFCIPLIFLNDFLMIFHDFSMP